MPGLRAIAVLLVLLCAPIPTAFGAPPDDADAQAAEGIIEFDIPAQPLASALQHYALISRRPALFSSEMVAGRYSRALRGRYSPEAALHRLLERTGLAAQQGVGGSANAFVLKAIAPEAASRPAPGLDFAYGAHVQAGVWAALCADARTAPGSYRALLRFHVDGDGRLREPRLLTSTGSAARDTAVLRRLAQVRVDRSPPRNLPQPLTMILLPDDERDADGVASQCGASAHGSAG